MKLSTHFLVMWRSFWSKKGSESLATYEELSLELSTRFLSIWRSFWGKKGSESFATCEELSLELSTHFLKKTDVVLFKKNNPRGQKVKRT